MGIPYVRCSFRLLVQVSLTIFKRPQGSLRFIDSASSLSKHYPAHNAMTASIHCRIQNSSVLDTSNRLLTCRTISVPTRNTRRNRFSTKGGKIKLQGSQGNFYGAHLIPFEPLVDRQPTFGEVVQPSAKPHCAFSNTNHVSNTISTLQCRQRNCYCIGVTRTLGTNRPVNYRSREEVSNPSVFGKSSIVKFKKNRSIEQSDKAGGWCSRAPSEVATEAYWS